MTQQSIQDRILGRSPETAEPAATRPENNPPLEQKRHWGRAVLGGVLGLAVIAAAGVAALQWPAIVDVFAQDSGAEPTATNTSLPDSLFLDHARQVGLTKCGAVYPVLGQILSSGTRYNLQTEWHNGEPDNHIVQGLVGMTYATPDYTGPAAGVVFAAPNGSACEGAMVRIVPFPNSCENMPAAIPGGTKSANLEQVAIYNVANNGGQVLLLPSGQSCVVISVTQAAG